MGAWNVVITVRERKFETAWAHLQDFGKLRKTDYYNVVTLLVADLSAFQERLAALCAERPDILNVLSRVAPAQVVFTFQTAEEFDEKARAAVLGWLPDLAGKSFHVRLYRRGFKGRILSPEEERSLDAALLSGLAARGTPGRMDFEDPDMVIDVETVGNRAGLSLWSRADLARYPFLRVR
ncbi:THUMP domain-containing protein [Actibacterium sp. MT2.3-13A]|uniref:THUMP domain-containing protein n=1 Tax=Actibacterium sp. MT2.3-13A TaxID=2828332 RepID=UPI001BACC049|nr:THUMP domain-containing protein [Actibacterium sp. MT2.3-13A]